MDQQVPIYEIVVPSKLLFGKEMKYKLVFYENRLEVLETQTLSKPELEAIQAGKAITFQQRTVILYDKVTYTKREMVLGDFRFYIWGDFLCYKSDGTTINISYMPLVFSPLPDVDYELLLRTYCPTILPDVKAELAFNKKISQLSAMTPEKGTIEVHAKGGVYVYIKLYVFIDGYNIKVQDMKPGNCLQLQLPYGSYLLKTGIYRDDQGGGEGILQMSKEVEVILSKETPVDRFKSGFTFWRANVILEPYV